MSTITKLSNTTSTEEHEADAKEALIELQVIASCLRHQKQRRGLVAYYAIEGYRKYHEASAAAAAATNETALAEQHRAADAALWNAIWDEIYVGGFHCAHNSQPISTPPGFYRLLAKKHIVIESDGNVRISAELADDEMARAAGCVYVEPPGAYQRLVRKFISADYDRIHVDTELTDDEMARAAGCVYIEGIEGARLMVQKGLTLVRESEERSLLGFALIGRYAMAYRAGYDFRRAVSEYSPFAQSTYANHNIDRKSGWICVECFRHSKEKTFFCKEHSRSESEASWKRSRRQLGAVSFWPKTVTSLRDRFLREREKVRDAADTTEWMRDVGLYQPQPPKDWKDRVTGWLEIYSWLTTTPELADSRTWSDVTNALRIRLRDVYCFSEDFLLWEAKLCAFAAEIEMTKAVQSIAGKQNKDSQPMPEGTSHTKNISNQNEIDRSLRVIKAALSLSVSNGQKLHQLHSKTGHKSGVNTEPN